MHADDNHGEPCFDAGPPGALGLTGFLETGLQCFALLLVQFNAFAHCLLPLNNMASSAVAARGRIAARTILHPFLAEISP